MPAMLGDLIFKIEDVRKLGAAPDYSGAQHLPIVTSLATRAAFETQPVGPVGTAPPAPAIQYVFFGKLTYREMNGQPHESGFALMLGPHFAVACDYNSDAYNYYT
jgi:hypothetical protein